MFEKLINSDAIKGIFNTDAEQAKADTAIKVCVESADGVLSGVAVAVRLLAMNQLDSNCHVSMMVLEAFASAIKEQFGDATDTDVTDTDGLAIGHA